MRSLPAFPVSESSFSPPTMRSSPSPPWTETGTAEKLASTTSFPAAAETLAPATSELLKIRAKPLTRAAMRSVSDFTKITSAALVPVRVSDLLLSSVTGPAGDDAADEKPDNTIVLVVPLLELRDPPITIRPLDCLTAFATDGPLRAPPAQSFTRPKDA